MPRRAVLLCLLLLAAPWARGAETFRAGAYAQDITPTKFPISVNGNMQDVKATKVHDRLHARCLVLDDGAMRVALVVCDSCLIQRPLLDEAKALAAAKTGIPASRMLISATHTHTAPTVAGAFQSDPDPDYVKFLAERIALGIEKAATNLAPAHVGWGVGKDPTQIFNRRWHMKPGTARTDPFGGTTDRVQMNPGYQNPGLDRPAGPTDPDVSFLAVRTADGRPLALFANYSLHYVGGVSPLSADYFGAFAERIGALLEAGKGEPPFVGAMTNGTSGDVNNINFAGPPPGPLGEFERIRVVADSVARAAHTAYRGTTFHERAKLAVAERELELGVRLPTEADVARAKEILAAAEGKGLKTLPEIYARETVLMTKFPSTVKAKLQAIRVGELGIVAIPCEVFAEIGLEIKRTSPLKPTFVITLANGHNGYLPTPEQHRLGGYETWRARSSYLEPQASVKITAAVAELLREIAR